MVADRCFEAPSGSDTAAAADSRPPPFSRIKFDYACLVRHWEGKPSDSHAPLSLIYPVL